MTCAAATDVAVVAGVRCEKDVLTCELADTNCLHDIPNRDDAGCVDRQHVRAVAQQCVTMWPKASPTNNGAPLAPSQRTAGLPVRVFQPAQPLTRTGI